MSVSRLDRSGHGMFTREEFLRAWNMEGTPPPILQGSLPTTILLSRIACSPRPSQRLRATIDGQPWSELPDGAAVSRAVVPGEHVIRISNGWFTKVVRANVASGQQVRLRCGTGTPQVQWLMALAPRIAHLLIWIARE